MFALEFPTLRKFFAWWIGELRACLPGAGSDTAREDKRRLTITAFSEALEIRIGKERNGAPLIAIANDDPFDRRTRERYQSQLRKFLRQGKEQALIFAPEMILQRTLQLPAAAGEYLREVLGFEMDRYTPYLANEVYYGYRRDQAASPAGMISVELLVIPKTVAEPFVDKLAQLNLQPTVFGVRETDGSIGQIRIYPHGRASRQNRATNLLNFLLLGIFIGILVGAVYLDVNKLQNDVERLNGELARIGAEARKTVELRHRLEALTAQMTTPLTEKRKRLSAVELLNLITGTLPDGTYLQRLNMRKGVITLTGYSDNASALIDKLEQTGALVRVKFVSPVTHDSRVGRDRFNIRADLVKKGN